MDARSVAIHTLRASALRSKAAAHLPHPPPPLTAAAIAALQPGPILPASSQWLSPAAAAALDTCIV